MVGVRSAEKRKSLHEKYITLQKTISPHGLRFGSLVDGFTRNQAYPATFIPHSVIE